ncbi:cytochrome C oxidase subunit IV family protein [Erythrobacter sp.]|uniref:cytochrome o ubiquinol oxidase subunit IV n=1 Tax=Erythrobacter sp. TaxID=1042 RepID=UPI00311EEF49
MDRGDIPRSERDGARRELRDLVLGLSSAAILTALSFAVVIFKPVGHGWMLGGLGLLAIVQIAAQFRFFLHIDLRKSHRDDLQLILFTALVVSLMVAGSICILFDQHARMM